jgi:DNA-binding XRE family transcriptional regulator
MGISEMGKMIKQRRKMLNITQPHLAELAGVSKNTLYKLENGQSNPSWQVVEKLTDVLGLDIHITIKKMGE